MSAVRGYRETPFSSAADSAERSRRLDEGAGLMP